MASSTIAALFKSYILLSFTALAVLASMAPSDMQGHNKDINLLRKVFRSKQPVKQATMSDAMELYSIAARQVLRVSKMKGREEYDPKYILGVSSESERGNNQNKFVTETVTFQSLRIKSLDNQMFICVKSGKNSDKHEIVFKVDKKFAKDGKSSSRMRSKSNLNKHNKIRKRCLFTWDFTHHMHIQLTVTVNNQKMYLAVKEGSVQLLSAADSSEIERSFIWVPTKNPIEREEKKRRKKNRKNRNNRYKKHLTASDNSRAFKDETTTNICDESYTLSKSLLSAQRKIQKLKNELRRLKQ